MKLGTGSVDGLRFDRVLGYGEKVGHGTVYSYTIYIERGLKVNREQFVLQVESILADQRGWIRSGDYAFQRVPKYANTRLVLASPATTDKLCYPLNTEGKVSCHNAGKVVVNIDRWREGVPHWTGTVKTYRQMLINHEFGHRIGHNHAYCAGAGKLAPVMQQQTYGLQGCRANSWPLDSEL